MTDTEFESAVRRALLDANRMEWSAALAGAETGVPDFSPSYLRKRLKLLNAPFSYAKKAARPAWKQLARTAACVLLTAALSFGALMAVSPQVRAWVQEIVVQWLDDHAGFRFGAGTGEVAPEDLYLDTWRPTWLPEGTRLVEEESMVMVTLVTYKEADGTWFYFEYTAATSNGSFNVDNEHQDYREITVSGHTAYLMEANEAGYMSFLIWVDEETNLAFCITSELSGAEMVEIAESVTKIE